MNIKQMSAVVSAALLAVTVAAASSVSVANEDKANQSEHNSNLPSSITDSAPIPTVRNSMESNLS